MTPSRLTRARELAGLSIVQASRKLGWRDAKPLERIEDGDATASDDILQQLADLYGVSVAWLRGEDVELPAATRAVLREVEDHSDRARLSELLEATQGNRPRSGKGTR